MRYTQEERAKNRQAILTAATRLIKEKGYAGVSVDEIAAAAGLTSGALYSQYPSKQAVFEAVLEAQLEGVLGRWLQFKGARTDWLEAAISNYLSLTHCRNVGGGCPIASLSLDAARSQGTRRRYQKRLVATVSGVQRAAGAKSRERFWAIYALLVGGMILARAMHDERVATEVLESSRTCALELARASTGTEA